MEIFFEVHKDLPRENPGGDEYTRQAFQMLPELAEPRILDIGCGPGAQTVELARLTDGRITALDVHQPFLDRLSSKAEALGLSDRITCINGSMFEMNFPNESFDVVWAEGSIYIAGFQKGLTEWRWLITPGGFLVVNDVVWQRPNPPQEILTFWRQAYPGMLKLEEVLDLISSSCYSLLGQFTLPENAWWCDYYTPMEERIRALRVKYAHDPEVLATLEHEQGEIEMYGRYHDWYGCEFFVMQKTLPA